MKSETGSVISVNISQEKGTVKKPVDKIVIEACGIKGDAHAGIWHRQISILSQEDIDRFQRQMDRKIAPGEFAENITISGIDTAGVTPLDRFRIGQAELEVTQIGKKCHGDNCAIFREVGKCVMPEKGIFTKVITNGTVKPQDKVTLQRKVLSFWIITLSDRAWAGQYPDRSGPAIKHIVADFFKDKARHISFKHCLIGDNPKKLKEKITDALATDADVIFTTGGTGIGPKDITVDVITAIADKTIPGIMEHIRVKYGNEKPNALLSRSVAAVKNKTLIYTLPGSVKAVNEYTPEVLKTLEHCIYTLNGLDLH